VVGKVIEISITSHLMRKLLAEPALAVTPADSSRKYPDLSFSGSSLGETTVAVDVKVARRSSATRIKSAISIGTYAAEYFHYPEDNVANIMAPYGSYAAHLAIIALYDYGDATAHRVELLVVEKWRVALHKRSSGTRCYIATSTTIADLKEERGDFHTQEEFLDFWRSQPVDERKRRRWKEARNPPDEQSQEN